jgi:type II secretory pathway pseudopilin PulG
MQRKHFLKNKHSNQASFSLVEALLATTILGISVAGILTTFSSAMLMSKLSEDYSIASSLMGELHTYVRSNQFTPYETNSGTFQQTYPQYSWQVNYLPCDKSDLYQVEMIIIWQHGSRVYDLTYHTYHYYTVPEDSTDSSETSR